MSELVPNYKWSEIQNMTLEEIKKLPSCEIVGEDGESKSQAVFLLIPSSDFLRSTFENKGMLSNAILPRPFNEPPKKPELYISDKPPKEKRKKRSKK